MMIKYGMNGSIKLQCYITSNKRYNEQPGDGTASGYN